MYKIFLILCVCTALTSPALAKTPYTYWPGFTGSVSNLAWPFDPSAGKDRYLTLDIQLPEKPQAKPDAYTSALHAACQRHRGELLAVARQVSPDNDWRAKISFEWHISTNNGVTLKGREHRYMWLSNCREA